MIMYIIYPEFWSGASSFEQCSSLFIRFCNHLENQMTDFQTGKLVDRSDVLLETAMTNVGAVKLLLSVSETHSGLTVRISPKHPISVEMLLVRLDRHVQKLLVGHPPVCFYLRNGLSVNQIGLLRPSMPQVLDKMLIGV